MQEYMPVVLFVGFLVLVVAGGIYSYIQAAKRRQALAEWARRNGWRFDQNRKDSSYEQRYGFGCLERGEADRYAFNIVEGEHDGRPIVAFDYHYVTYSHGKHGRKRHTHYFSAVIVQCELPLKPLKIRRETVLDKVVNFFGRNTINFESAEFSKRFHVESPDRRWAYDVIHARTMQLLMKAPAFEIEMRGPWLIAASDRQMGVPRFNKAVRLLDNLLDNLPDYVRQDLREGAR